MIAEERKKALVVTGICVLVLFLILGLIAGGMAGIPKYKVWQQGLAGLAQLRKAEQNRQIQIEQAKAEKESAQFRASAIEIVGKAAQDYPEYRYQEFLGAFAEALQNGDIDKLIFVPTEANIPITEAGRTIK